MHARAFPVIIFQHDTHAPEAHNSVFSTTFVTFVTYYMRMDACTQTQPTHWANPIANWSSLVLNPCNPDADFTLWHHFQLHLSGRHGSRTTKQGRKQRRVLLSIKETRKHLHALFYLLTEYKTTRSWLTAA